MLCAAQTVLVAQATLPPLPHLPPLSGLQESALLTWLQRHQAQLVDTTGAPVRVVFELGRLDTRLQLAPCQRIEPYLPAGTRLWGRSRIGLRCAEGSTRWDISWPLQVKVWGRGWSVRTAVPEGSPLHAGLLSESEVDWATEGSPVLTEAQQWEGQFSVRALTVGQVLRAALVRPPQWFASGATVRVVVEGAGFAVTTEGQALGPGVQGQPVRVRLETGRVVNAWPRDAHSVSLSP